MDNYNVTQELIDFLRNDIGEFEKKIDINTAIEDDLGVTGVEGVELIENFAKHFNVDISKFNFKNYFHPEPSFFNTYNKIEALRVGDLQKAIIIGKLE